MLHTDVSYIIILKKCSLNKSIYTNQHGFKIYIQYLFFVSFLQPENTVENQTTKPKSDGCVLILHHVQSASGEHTCLPGGVNALSGKFNENFSMESDSAEETIQSIKLADIDEKHSRLTDCDMTSEEPTCIQCVFNTEACAQSNEADTCSAEEAIQSIEQADIDGKHSEGLTDCDRTSEEPTCICCGLNFSLV